MKGIPILVGIIGNLSEENILSRAARTVANLAQDERNAARFHREGVVDILIKVLSEAAQLKTKQVIVRALR